MPKLTLDRYIQIAMGILVVLLVVAIYMPLHENVVQVGDRAPDFSIKADNGRTYTKADFGGKLLILNFWATWCPPCREELPSLDALQRTLGSKGLVVLAVSVDKDDKAYRDFLTANKVAITTARDPGQDINREYGTVQFPESYIIDQNGRVVEKIISSTNWMDERMVSHVQSML
ncbi:MAG TPA: TlpA disulfide reductase family protein [Bryobacteraceae bacterium]|jgi:peroxiredoxin